MGSKTREGELQDHLTIPYLLHSKDMEIKEGLVYLPLYMTTLL